MAVIYSTNLGLALPAQGDWPGTWGTNQNNYITQYIDAAVAGGQTISGTQTAVTLNTNNGTSLTQVNTGPSGSAQYQIINCTGSPASLLTITAPATSKTYVVINGTSTNQSVKIVGAGPTTGVTVLSGRKALVAWNGSDFVEVSGNINALTINNSGSGAASGATYNGSTAITISYNTVGAPSATGTGASGTWGININGTVGATTPAVGTFTLLKAGNSSTSSSGTLNAPSDTVNQWDVQATGGAVTFGVPSGTPVNSQKLLIRITDDATARGLTWNAIFRPIGTTLPSITFIGKTIYVGCVYNSTIPAWDVVAVTTQV
jgi:hypothetical protein